MSDIEKELREKIKQAEQEMLEREGQDEPTEQIEEINNDIVDKEENVEDVENVEEEVVEDDVVTDEEPDVKTKPKTKQENAFQKMRHDLKEKDAQLQALREQMARVEGAQEAMLKPKDEPVTEEIPDKEYDPDGYRDYQLEQKEKRIAALEANYNALQQRASIQQAEAVYIDLESKYVEKDPTYKDAKAFYKNERARTYKEQNPLATPAQINEQVKNEEYRIVSSLAQYGLSEEAIFNTFKGQAYAMGFKDLPVARKDNTKLKRNMAKSASLNDAPTATGSVDFTPEQLNQLARKGTGGLAGLDQKALKRAQAAVDEARMKSEV